MRRNSRKLYIILITIMAIVNWLILKYDKHKPEYADVKIPSRQSIATIQEKFTLPDFLTQHAEISAYQKNFRNHDFIRSSRAITELIKQDLLWMNTHKLNPDDLFLREIILKRFLHPPSQEPYNFMFDSNKLNTFGQLKNVEHLLTAFVHILDGFYVDIRAQDGEYNSKSLWLEMKLGWNGLLIEPDPIIFKSLKAKHRKAWHINFGLSRFEYPAQVKLYRHPQKPELSSLTSYQATNKMLWIDSGVAVECVPLYTLILALNRTSVDFLNFDLGGTDFDILETIPFDKVVFKVVAISWHHNPAEKLLNFMMSKGFIRHFGQGMDTIFMHMDFIVENWNT